MADTVGYAHLNDHGVIVEWQLPLSSRRLDVLLTGRGQEGQAGAVIVELKQWDQAYPTTVQDCVVAFVGGRRREMLHPSAMVLALLALDPLGFGRESTTSARWWAERPLWVIASALILLPLLWLFARWERPRALRTSRPGPSG